VTDKLRNGGHGVFRSSGIGGLKFGAHNSTPDWTDVKACRAGALARATARNLT
jgi:hypothetical protein